MRLQFGNETDQRITFSGDIQCPPHCLYTHTHAHPPCRWVWNVTGYDQSDGSVAMETIRRREDEHRANKGRKGSLTHGNFTFDRRAQERSREPLIESQFQKHLFSVFSSSEKHMSPSVWGVCLTAVIGTTFAWICQLFQTCDSQSDWGTS